MGTTELHHNTPAQVRAYLREALDVVAELDPPDDLREACFQTACNLTSAKQIMMSQSPIGIPGPALAIPGARH